MKEIEKIEASIYLYNCLKEVLTEYTLKFMKELKNKFKPKAWDSQGEAVGSYIDETILPELKEMWSKLINGDEDSENLNRGDEKKL